VTTDTDVDVMVVVDVWVGVYQSVVVVEVATEGVIEPPLGPEATFTMANNASRAAGIINQANLLP
jgi:hypothetical protein